MFFGHIFVAVSLLTFLQDFHVSCDACVQNCTDKPTFTPSSLVVRFGDPTSASCTVCQHLCPVDLYGLEHSVGVLDKNGTTISWSVDNMTEWDTTPQCYYMDDSGVHITRKLSIILYQPPNDVSFSINHTGPMLEGDQYTLQCKVQDVAPVQNLIVTFYRGKTVLGQLKSNNKVKKPATEIFTLNINTSKEDDGLQYWCEAKLELGPEGPLRPPVVNSQHITATVYYEPHLEGSSHPVRITIAEGNPLQLNCSAVANPNPLYTWTVPSDGLTPPNSSVLFIDAVALEHKGQYTCAVSNKLGTATVNFNVDVQVNYNTYIIVGVIVAAAVVIMVVAFIYTCYYKNNRCGQYNLMDVLRPNARSKSTVV